METASLLWISRSPSREGPSHSRYRSKYLLLFASASDRGADGGGGVRMPTRTYIPDQSQAYPPPPPPPTSIPPVRHVAETGPHLAFVLRSLQSGGGGD